MKNIFILLFYIWISCMLTAKEDSFSSKIYNKLNPGIVYIETGIYLDSNYAQNTYLFSVVEKELERKILNSYLPLISGTGFFITNDGYLITNHHVINIEDPESVKKDLLSNIKDYILYNFPSKLLGADEKKLVIEDFKKMIAQSQLKLRVILKDQTEYTAEILKSDKDKDLALLKIQGKDLRALPFGNSNKIEVGNKVIAIGYPLQTILGTFFHDIKSTTTNGIISALRNENWGIQHTATINPGNSGGPLINLNGEVIGINVGELKNANSIYFSIPIDNLINWLKEIDQQLLITHNKMDTKKLGIEYELTDEGCVEVSSSVYVDTIPGLKIYFNDHYFGITPQVINNLGPGKGLLKIIGENGYSEQMLLVKSNTYDIFTYSPYIKEFTGSIYINAIPGLADIYLDNNKVGISPILIKDISTGYHRLKIILYGYLTEESDIYVEKNSTVKKTIALKKGYRVLFNPPLIDNSTITLINKKNEKLNFNSNEHFFISDGSWEIGINHNLLEPFTKNILIQDQDVTIDFNPQYKKALIKINNIEKGSKIIFDDKDITSSIKEGELLTEFGIHKLRVLHQDYKFITKKIYVDKKEITINLKYSPYIPSFTESYKPVGLGLMLPGITFVLSGISMFSASLAYYYASSYDETANYESFNDYVVKKQQMQGVFGVGICFGVLGLVFIGISIPFFVVNKVLAKRKLVLKEIQMRIQRDNRLELAVALCI